MLFRSEIFCRGATASRVKPKTKTIEKLNLAGLGLTREAVAPRQKISKVYVPVKTSRTQFLEGSPKEIAARLVDKLKNEARVV